MQMPVGRRRWEVVTVMMPARVPEIAAVITMNSVAVSNHLFCLDQAPTWTSLYPYSDQP